MRPEDHPASLPGQTALVPGTSRSTRRWVQKASFLVCVLVALDVTQANAQIQGAAHTEYPGKHWNPAAKPEDRGWSSEKLAAAKAYTDSLDTAAVIVVDDGIIVSQWGATATKFNVHSIRKSFLSALYGIAIAKGQIELNTTLDQLGIDDNEPSLTPEEKQARVVDLLKARSGIYHAPLYESPAMRAKSRCAVPTHYAHFGTTTTGTSMRWEPSMRS